MANNLSNAVVSNIKPRILIIEQNPTQTAFYIDSLGNQFICELALGSKQALEMAVSSATPDLILVDLMMPNHAGFTVCAELKRHPVTMNIPIIFVGTTLSDEDKEHAFALGCVDYLMKPMLVTELLNRVHTHIALRQQSQLLVEIQSKDPLTELATRRQFHEVLTREWNRCTRYSQPLSLLIINIDNFRQFNDVYGHVNGDQCLISVAQSLQAIGYRPSDLLARLGTQEFVLLLSDCDQQGAIGKVRELLAAVDTLFIPFQEQTHSDVLTVSIGGTVMIPQHGSDPLELVRAADDALYEAKNDQETRYVINSRLNTSTIAPVLS